MPKVTEEYRAARRQQILEAAWTCFARNGFHATSMADVIKESGLSAGAVYGYFVNKEDLIQQAAEATIGQAAGPVARDLSALDPPDLARAVIITLEHVTEILLMHDIDKSAVAIQAFAEALRSPHLMTVIQGAHGRLRSELTGVAVRAKAAGLLDDEADPEQVGAAMFGLVPGMLLQRLTLGVDVDDYCAGVVSLIGARRPATTQAE
ncbi:TetR/AcrR family transcriptional regulator [Luteipulveratus mongoliensis]|uniref:HTH tetR-type domain-containing protein n=1 Tax=Luteipulveratus mongoliensis TaxID=571913 RepID=A0A0K1JK07_9MICO|nr:TetR/AcrR family transcriptional regulator [Luteipulveratus mongoliensis]AKU17052.1 hypothetical protein VV02_16240 [Luteipulveratus mongoliensis]